MDSILTSIKKLLGISEEYTHFDPDLIMHINSVFMILNQMGVGPSRPLTIEDELTTWTEFIQDKDYLEGIKTLVAMRVRLIFDPPQSSAHIEAIKNTIAELEWRLYTAEHNPILKGEEV